MTDRPISFRQSNFNFTLHSVAKNFDFDFDIFCTFHDFLLTNMKAMNFSQHFPDI